MFGAVDVDGNVFHSNPIWKAEYALLCSTTSAAPHMAPRFSLPLRSLLRLHFTPSTTLSTARFNAIADPHAAKAVLSSAIPNIILVPLDATEEAPMSPEYMASLATLQSYEGRFVSELTHRVRNDWWCVRPQLPFFCFPQFPAAASVQPDGEWCTCYPPA